MVKFTEWTSYSLVIDDAKARRLVGSHRRRKEQYESPEHAMHAAIRELRELRKNKNWALWDTVTIILMRST